METSPRHLPERHPVVIVGGGWAGLATAAELCRHDIPVTLLEAASQLGGRARSIRTRGLNIDNGQHLFIGAYRSLLDLMAKIGVDPQHAFLRQPLTLRLIKGNRTSLSFKAPGLPAPLHLLYALATARGLSMADRLHALAFGRRLPELRTADSEDISVQALLLNEAQTPRLIRKLWGPLCIAVLNTAPAEASAQLFLRALRESFLEHRERSDLLIPRLALDKILPAPCADYLQQRGGRIQLGERVTGLEIGDRRVHAVQTRRHRITASHVVLATPHVISRRLMSRHQPLQTLCTQLSELGNEPVVTLYLQYPSHTRLPQPLLGLEDRLAQWIFDRRVCGQAGMMGIVISAWGLHLQMHSEALTRQVATELATAFPDWPPHEWSLLIREKRATFSSHVGINRIRPANRTPVNGLWLAGDYTANGLPATVEAAVRSGLGCAQAILASYQ